jgi:hypothetical protein
MSLLPPNTEAGFAIDAAEFIVSCEALLRSDAVPDTIPLDKAMRWWNLGWITADMSAGASKWKVTREGRRLLAITSGRTK